MVSMQSLQAAKNSPHGSPLRGLTKEKVLSWGGTEYLRRNPEIVC